MKLELLKPLDMKLPGAIIERPGGVASVLIMRGLARPTEENQPKPKAKTK